MRAIVIAGGTIGSPAFYKSMIKQNDRIICADSGYINAAKIGLVPDLVIGDFDSSKRSGVPDGVPVRELPVEKDRTDLHECLVTAMEEGATEVVVFGARGSRLDHSMAAISLLRLGLERGVNIRLVDECNEVFLIDKEAVIPQKKGYKLSLLPMTPVKGICTEGLYYPLQNAEMDWGNPYGVSNEFIDETAKITVKKGILMVMVSRD